MNAGWVAISRKIMNSPDLRTPAERWAMVWMVMEAAWQPTEVACANHKSVVVRRGQFSHSLRHLAREWGMTEPTVRRFLKRLEERRTIRRSADAERDAGQLVVTVCNYEQYQSPLRGADAAPDALPDAASDAKYNKDKNNKQKKDKAHGKREPVPSFDEEFWPEAYAAWKRLGANPGSKAEAKASWQRLTVRARQMAPAAVTLLTDDIISDRRNGFPELRPKHVCRWLRNVEVDYAHRLEEVPDDEIPSEGRLGGRDAAEQRGADAPRTEDRPAGHDERVLRGGESLRGVCGGDGPVECAAPGGRAGSIGVAGLPAPLGAGHAEPHHIRAGSAQHPRRDDLDANPLALGDDGHSGGRPAWVH